MTAHETWAPIPGCPGYEVSDQGRVRSLRRRVTRLMRTRPHAVTGRTLVNLTVDGDDKTFYVARLVMLAFRGPPPDGTEVRHVITNDVTDNRLVNLAYGTKVENAADRVRHGTQARGEKHSRARHSDQVVALFAADPRPVSVLAAEYGVSPGQAYWYRRGLRGDPLQAEKKRAARVRARLGQEPRP